MTLVQSLGIKLLKGQLKDPLKKQCRTGSDLQMQETNQRMLPVSKRTRRRWRSKQAQQLIESSEVLSTNFPYDIYPVQTLVDNNIMTECRYKSTIDLDEILDEPQYFPFSNSSSSSDDEFDFDDDVEFRNKIAKWACDNSDCLKYGNLSNFSAFPFENEMQYLKTFLRSRRYNLQQVVRRVSEMETAKCSNEYKCVKDLKYYKYNEVAR
ncbi:hypothetical protein Ocin01_17151 [Orchesella cincta]|uniref:Uncharacterized protein n=1 Tax=Orchesella cincta TaxID=48709 RepID=A0A1D2M982_ORCCI|nr:hypothetical protein Ocin01_17151 [Orchesella cincta]